MVERLHAARHARVAVRRAPRVGCQTFAADVVPLLRRVAVSQKQSVRSVRRLVANGRVYVDGHRCTDQLALVSSLNHVGVLCRKSGTVERLEAPHPKDFYLKLFKPRGVTCTHRQEPHSKFPIITAMYPTGTQGMLHCVGRLDRDSEGLLLLTSDGAFSRFATMPEAHLEKEYLAVTSCVKDGAPPSQDVLKQFQAGVLLHDGEARASAAEVVDFDGRLARLRLVVTEGRFRMVRRMLRALGYCCLQLLRTRVGQIGGIALHPETMAEAATCCGNTTPDLAVAPAILGDAVSLRPGEFAALAPDEIADVYRCGLPWLDAHHPV